MNLFNKKLFLLSLLICFVTGGLFVNQKKAAHRFHTSFTRMDYNESDKLIEISIRLFTHDFVEVFQNKNKTNPLDLENVDETILKYLNEHFVLTDKNDSKLKLVWVGKEVTVDTLEIFVEIPFEGNLEELKLKNTIFFNNYQKQINYVTARFAGKKSDLVFKVGDKEKLLK